MARRGSCLVNLLTLAVLLGTCAMGAVSAAILANPYLPFINPFPPPTLPSVAVLPSVTATSLFPTFPPTWTSTFTPSPSSAPAVAITETPTRLAAATTSATSEASGTPDETAAALALTPSPTGPTPTRTRTLSAFQFTVQGEGPVAVQNFANSQGCNWMGIGGQAFNLAGNPIVGLIVHLDGGDLNLDAITGSKTAYGAGGYEFTLNDHVVQTKGEFRVQLRDTSGVPLSDFVVVDTFADCKKNLLLVNFVQNH